MNDREYSRERGPRRRLVRCGTALGVLAIGFGMSGCQRAEMQPVPEVTPTVEQPELPEAPTTPEMPSPSPTMTELPSPVPTVDETFTPQPTPVETQPSPEVVQGALAEAVQPFIDQYSHLREMGVVVYDWETGETFAYNEHQEFVSASLFKLYVAYGVLNGVDRGNISLDERLPIDPNIDHDIYIPAEGITIGECMERMITISSNTCGRALNQRVGLAELDELLHQQGFTETSINPYRNGPAYSDRVTSAHDVSALIRRLYDNELLSPESTELLIGHLRNQQLGYALPTGLHAGMTLDHKPGYLPSAQGTYSHDAGVIYGYGDQIQATLLTYDQIDQSPAVFTDFGRYLAQYMQR